MRDPLRFAVICDHSALEAWQRRCLEHLLAVDGVRLGLRIILVGPAQESANHGRDRQAPARSRWFRRYQRFFLRPAARRHVSAGDLLNQIPYRVCQTTLAEEGRRHLQAADVEAISRLHLDFMLYLGVGSIGGRLLDTARFGVWAFAYGDPQGPHREPPGFWEIYHGEATTAGSLRRLARQGAAGAVLKSGYLKTLRYSYAGNLGKLLFESAQWPAQVCRDIRNGVAEYLEAAPPTTSQAPTRSTPTDRELVRFLLKILRNLWAEMLDTFFRHGLWNIGLVHAPIHAFLDPRRQQHIHYLATDKRRFLADPFGIVHQEKLTVLCEEFDYDTYRGVISSIEVEGVEGDAGRTAVQGRPVQSQPAMQLPVHASHPYLFEHQGDIYCVPETARMREVSLYRALHFPRHWAKVAVLLADVAGVDATVFQHDGLWWLTCTDKDQGAHVKLFIWYAPDLCGPWLPHAANPVKTDVRSARPAGTPFTHQSRLYRPAQDCSQTYGGGIVIHQVLRLTPIEFIEVPVATIQSDACGRYPDGIHTLSAVGDITLVDGKRFVFKGKAFRQALRRELGRIGLFRYT